MTLGQFATAVGAPKRWVQNAFQALGLPAKYDEPLARRLAFAKAVKEACGMPLRRAFPLAEEALASWPAQRTWVVPGREGSVRVEIDLERFLSTCAVNLSLSRTWYAEKQRGRPRKKKLRGLALARWWGVDIGLLQETLKRTPEERLRTLDDAVEDLKTMKVLRR